MTENVNSKKKSTNADSSSHPKNGTSDHIPVENVISREIVVKPDAVTDEGVIRCRFDMFVRVYPNRKYRFPGRQMEWCYRGDKFTDDLSKMLINLIKLANRKINDLQVIELYDNTRPKNDADRIVLKIFNGRIEINNLKNYTVMLDGQSIPELFKTDAV